MFPLESNQVGPCRQDSLESWHQVLPHPPRPNHNSDRYKWDDINALFDQVQIVSVNRSSRTDGSKADPSKDKDKGKKVRSPVNIKLKRLVKTKAGGKRIFHSVADLNISSKGRKMRLKLGGKRGTPATSQVQSTKKSFKKAIRIAAKSHK